MLRTSTSRLVGAGLALLLVGPLLGQTSPAAKPKQFAYVLKLAPRLIDSKAWTDADNAAVGKHFQYLKAATEKGQVIFAGRSSELNDKTFGIVVYEAADEAAAKSFMAGDEAVRTGVMTAELFPFLVALQRKPAS
jgi:uncharacterized protein YciI